MARAAQRYKNLWIWDRLRDKLAWYHGVSTNAMPAKYLICNRIASDISDLKSAGEEELWKEHDRLTQVFVESWRDIRQRDLRLSDLEKVSPSLLDLSVELAERMITHCNICRWNCGVDRSKGSKHGTCQLESISRVACYFHHLGEELIFRGTMGSGTIFFTSCNMRCVFCQNGDISRDKNNGIPVTPKLLAAMSWQLATEGCHNINWVGGEPTIHLHSIIEAISLLPEFKGLEPDEMLYIRQAKSDDFLRWRSNAFNPRFDGGFNVAQLCNSNFFMSEQSMKILRCLTDIWLPDLKYGSDRCSIHLAKTPWYWDTVTRNHKLVYGWGEDVVIRHLIMPNHVECCTKPVLDWIAKNMPDTPVNIMDQYHPDYACNPFDSRYDPKYKELARFPTKEEILESYRYAKSLGLNFEALSYEKNVSGLTA